MDLCLVALVLTSSSASTGSDQVSTWSLVSWFKFLTLSLNSGTLCISFYSCIVYLSFFSYFLFTLSLSFCLFPIPVIDFTLPVSMLSYSLYPPSFTRSSPLSNCLPHHSLPIPIPHLQDAPCERRSGPQAGQLTHYCLPNLINNATSRYFRTALKIMKLGLIAYGFS